MQIGTASYWDPCATEKIVDGVAAVVPRPSRHAVSPTSSAECRWNNGVVERSPCLLSDGNLTRVSAHITARLPKSLPSPRSKPTDIPY